MKPFALLLAAVALSSPMRAEARDESMLSPAALARAASAPPAAAPMRVSAVSREDAAPRRRHSGAQPVFGPSAVPVGWLQFCGERPYDCADAGPDGAVMTMTPAREAELASVNLSINRALQPVADIEHYGVAQKWTIPDDGMGSCHHYMLMKRQELMRRGWPQSALLVTVVLDRKGGGHAVLTVRTSRGDLILDNLTSRIVAWNQTGYRYLMRQSDTSPNRFVSLGGSLPAKPVATATRRVAEALPATWWASGAARGAVWRPWR